ncbi:NAD(P)/FAD-dependent oxidoreductase [Actinoplanes sp. DH11]|uniref:dihydrolipoyl dehydrogenase family protein n=1 Tax=Actinoplanes sp. DH11 TaxID=2857011 RepID=UPI001E3CAEEE|nr:NAD(P)/FAD-dependent oxidoreductase [Actinoplanes sp. DH11]
MRTFDVVVVGAGPGGEVAAGYLAEAGLSVAIVEADKVGGECSFYACIPSKALLRPGELLAQARRVPGAAGAVTGPLDVAAVLARRDELIGHLDDAGQVPWLTERGIELVRGWGRLIGERRLAVTAGGSEEILEARKAIILAGGTRAALPPIPGLAEARPWTNREAVTAHDIPESLVVIGAGVVGAEMSQAYTMLGSRVKLIGNVLPKEEDFVAEQVTASLRDQGVDVRTGVRAVAVSRTGTEVRVTLGDGTTVTASEVLVAAGRVPQTTGLGLDVAGLTEGDFVAVDERMRVPSNDWLYVIGDLNGRALFTHMAKYQARLAASDILGDPLTTEHLADGPGSPRVIFTEPQVASVGHRTASAAAAGLRVRAIDVPTDGNAGGAFAGGSGGFARFLVDEDRDVLVGVTITGTDIADFLQAATIAVVGEIPVRRLRHAVPAFPTRSELWLKFFDALGSTR